MKTGRERDVHILVTHDKAVEVARLLMGKLDKPMRHISFDQYNALSRPRLLAGKASLRDGRANDVKSFCLDNFGTADISRLACLYDLLCENNSSIRLPLVKFAALIGQPQEGVFRGAPRHSTVCISQWGLQTEFPEMHLVRDVAVAFNRAIDLDFERDQFKEISYKEAKGDKRKELASINTLSAFYRRACVISCFNLLEAYINGVAWDYLQSNDLSMLSKRKQAIIENNQRAKLFDKIVHIPGIVVGREPGPLSHEKDPLKTFKDVIKPFRDSIVHASPFSATDRFGGYDKLSKLYELSMQTTAVAVDKTLDIVGLIYSFIGGVGGYPQWVPPRGEDRKFELS